MGTVDLNVIGGSAGTPDWPAPPNQKFLCHFEAAGPFVDDGDTGHTITTSGSVTSVAGAAKWGTNGGRFSGGYLSFPDHADFVFGTAAWGWEAWINPDAVSGAVLLFSVGPTVGNRLGTFLDLTQYAWFHVGGSANNKSSISTVVASSYQHVACQRMTDGTLVGFLGGVPVWAGDGEDSMTMGTTLYIATQSFSPGSNNFDGDMDEVLIWTGERLEAKTYAVPTGPYT